MQILEITIVGSSDTPYGYTSPTEIEFQPIRPEPYAHNPMVTKFGPQTLYYDITAPNFIGNLNGTATKATQDGDGAVISSTYLKRSGGTMTGQLKTNGTDIILGATGTGSAPNNSGDLVWQYGNGTEKMRIWSIDSYTGKMGPNFRLYNENSELLYTGNLPLADGTSATGTWGISVTGSAGSATKAT